MKFFQCKLLACVFIALFSFQSIVLAEPIDEVRKTIEQNYVDPVPASVLQKESIQEILAELDPYSSYLSPEEYQQFIESINLIFSGIGVDILESEYGFEITTVYEGSPAEVAGIQVGDHIEEIDGQALIGNSLEHVISLIRGETGTKINLSIIRYTEEDFFEETYELTRAKVSIPTVEYTHLRGNIGYIQLHSFNEESVTQMKEAIQQLYGVEGWIVDLRYNPGGLMNASQEIAGLFPNVDQAVLVEGKEGKRTIYDSIQQDVQFELPVHLLINKWSASASEVVAAAVKEQNGAKLYGQTTYGKGTIQSSFPIEDRGVLKLTTARFYSPNGTKIDNVGVTPDVETPVEQEFQFAFKDLLIAQNPLFRDTRSYDWAKEEIQVLGKMDIIRGKSPEIFDPTANITRAEFVTLISRLFELEAEDSGYPFNDVSPETWYANGVAVAYEYGWVTGKDEITFDPKGIVTREEMGTIVGRVLISLGYDQFGGLELLEYKDHQKVASWAKNSIEMVIREGIMVGYTEDTFAPKEKTNRAQAAVILYRLMFK